MKYSVVIPTYNSFNTLPRAIQSCLAQTVPPEEIIIVDDASSLPLTEEVSNLIEGNNCIKYFKLKKNRGVSYARNYGWENVRTALIAFLDSDDEWHLDKMKCCIHAFIHSENLDILWHNYSYESSNKNLIHESLSPLKSTRFLNLIFKSPIATCTVVVRKNIKIRFDESMRYCEDHDFLLRSSYDHSIYHLPMTLAIVHRKINSPGGLSGDTWKMRKGELKMYSKLGKLHFGFYLLIPILFAYSLIKHVRLLIKNK